MPFYWQTFKIILQVAIRRGPIGIAPSSSDRTIAGSIIIKNSIVAAKFLSSAHNSIILARTFASIPESVFLRFHSQTSRQVVGKLEAADLVGKGNEESGRQVQRFIRLTNLIPELLDMVDEKKISFNPAVELSYLDESQQRDFLEAMQDTQNAPSLSQAQQLKKMAQQGEFSYEKAFDVMGQEKKSEKDTVTIKNETLRKYFPRSYTPKQMEEKIIQLLDAWQKKQQRRNER